MPVTPEVEDVRVLEPGLLQVRFADGLQGTVRLEPSHLTGVFEPLRDPQVFAAARVVDGAVGWPTGVDLAPDAMYEAIARDGRWVLD